MESQTKTQNRRGVLKHGGASPVSAPRTRPRAGLADDPSAWGTGCCSLRARQTNVVSITLNLPGACGLMFVEIGFVRQPGLGVSDLSLVQMNSCEGEVVSNAVSRSKSAFFLRDSEREYGTERNDDTDDDDERDDERDDDV